MAHDGPDFLCVGAQKAGTRWLHDQLQRHPDFWMPAIKELSYFNRLGSRKAKARRLLEFAAEDLPGLNRRRARQAMAPIGTRDLAFLAAIVALEREVDLDAYARLFAGKGASISGDITPGYSTIGNPVIADINARFRQLRVVFIARDPVDRLWSQIGMDVDKGRISPVVDARTLSAAVDRPQVARRSSQSAIVARWRRQFGERFQLFFFDELTANPAELRRRMITFLGGDPAKPSGVPADFNRKAGKAKARMTPDIRGAIASHLADEIRACAIVLGGPATSWPGKYGL